MYFGTRASLIPRCSANSAFNEPPLLPMRTGHGTTSRLAALNVKSGAVLGQCPRRHQAIEFRKFLEPIDAAVPARFEAHLILDHYGTHKAPRIRR